MLSFVIFLGFFAFSLLGQGLSYQSLVSDWMKISAHKVCFKGHGNEYGSFHNFAKAGLVVAMKLEYVSGEIRCVAAVEYNSHWGCGDYPWAKEWPLNVVITDEKNKILFPKDKRLLRGAGNWYWLPYTDSKNTKNLIFTDFAEPFYLPMHAKTRVWYGEDLANFYEGDDQGRVCVNVYARFLV